MVDHRPLLGAPGALLLPLLLLLATASPLAGQGSPTADLRGLVTDPGGKPVAGVTVAQFWSQRGTALQARKGVRTDGSGSFVLKADAKWYPMAVLVVDEQRNRGALALYYRHQVNDRQTLVLKPLVKCRGRIASPKLGRPLGRYALRVNQNQCRYTVLDITPGGPAFEFWLPAGAYLMNIASPDCQPRRWPVTLKANRPVLDLGTLEVAPTTVAKALGGAAPPWTFTAVRGLPPTVKPAGLRGRWVLLYFWSVKDHNSAKCFMPKVLDLYKKHERIRNRFTILAVQSREVQSLAEVDKLAAAVAKEFWGDRRIPFPLAIDGTGATANAYGVSTLPKYVVIDPQGRMTAKNTLEAYDAVLEKVAVLAAKVKPLLRRLRYTKKRSAVRPLLEQLLAGDKEVARMVLLDYLPRCKDKKIRLDVFGALARVGGPRALAVLTGPEGLGSKDRRVRQGVLQALAASDDPDALVALCRVLVDPEGRIATVRQVAKPLVKGGLDRPGVEAAFLALLRHRTKAHRLLGLATLAERPGAAVDRALIAVLRQDPEAALRSQAAKALGRRRVAAAREALTRAATDDGSKTVRKAAGWALERLDR